MQKKLTLFLGLKFILIALLSGKCNEAWEFYAPLVYWNFQFTDDEKYISAF